MIRWPGRTLGRAAMALGLALPTAWANAQSAERTPAAPGAPTTELKAEPRVEPDVEAIEWKLALGHYHSNPGDAAVDLNLRGNLRETAFWIGHYARADNFRQVRLGGERWHDTPMGRLLTTVQVAERGYLNGSVSLEVGDAAIKPLLGFSRTNLREYFNIDFNPNDAFTAGAAVDQANGTRWSFYLVQDNRTAPGQRITHLTYRPAFSQGRRLMVDMFRRSGPLPGADQRISAYGATFTLDIKPMFVKLSYDPKANFVDSNMLRLSVGTHF